MNYPHYSGDPASETEWFDALIRLARFLRGPGGCPWDREQSSGDFAGFIRNEGAELSDALASGDNKHASEEFGDTIFTILATAAAAEVEGRFTLEDALREAHAKMIRRHEHVFGGTKAETPEDAIRAWNDVKAREKAL